MNHRRYHNLLREHLPFLVTGFIGGLLGTGLLVLISDRGLAPEAYAFAVAFTFLLFSVSQITAMAILQLLTANEIRLSLAALVPSLVFTRLGISLSRKISIAMFNKFLLTIFILMEIKLIMNIL